MACAGALRDDGDGWRVAAITLATFDRLLPSEEGPAFEGAEWFAWLAAVAVAVGLVLATVALMRLTPERAPDLRTRPRG